MFCEWAIMKNIQYKCFVNEQSWKESVNINVNVNEQSCEKKSVNINVTWINNHERISFNINIT